MEKKSPTINGIRSKLREAAAKSGMTQEQIGVEMGFSQARRHKAVSRLLNPEIDYDPRLSTLIEFAKAIGKPLKEIV